MKKRLLAVTTLSLTLALGAAGPAAADHLGPNAPPARTSENASCVGALSTILAQLKLRNEVNEPQQGGFVSQLAQRKGTTFAECFASPGG